LLHHIRASGEDNAIAIANDTVLVWEQACGRVISTEQRNSLNALSWDDLHQRIVKSIPACLSVGVRTQVMGANCLTTAFVNS
jgi:hypothetical protein